MKYYTYAIFNKNVKKFYYGMYWNTMGLRKPLLSKERFKTFSYIEEAETQIKISRLNNRYYKVVRLKCMMEEINKCQRSEK